MLDVLHTTLNVGLKKPVRLIHITEVSPKDEPWQQELMRERTEVFVKEGKYPENTPEEYFREAISLAKELDATLVVTGDVYDVYTSGNLAKFKEIISGEDMMFTPGGHEYQKQIVRTLEEPDGYGAMMEKKLKKDISEFDIDFEARVIGGVNVITANNALDYFPKCTVNKFEETLKNGLPTVVFFHDPLDDKLLNKTEAYHENVKITKEEYLFSHRMLDTLKLSSQVITTFSGHHHTSREYLCDDKIHYVTGGLFKGVCRLIEIK